eukprot:CAMPEP_0204916382 /NCGR_PEP_ID=MMETSP1397-20131031/14201_1 /ASSEMBLY_ACC=CAM_ASM_000891 /TAXON_ID=49980 /ORGANISM="Climacostomum Climacostomum virens, Strain Stock W-24" /LENGTH=329 /DNA_ID=CAMNT_0052088857 /DNA_START=804 /DNA_END=1793 /DNA_ORIENTATION=-
MPRKKAKAEKAKEENTRIDLGEVANLQPSESQNLPVPKQKPALYGAQLEQYIEEGMSQLGMLILRRLIAVSAIEAPHKSEPILMMLTKTAKEFLLNELELVVWSIYIDRFVWNDSSLPLKTLLLYSAFTVKSYLNRDVTALTSHFNISTSSLDGSFDAWHYSKQDQLAVSPIDLNERFSLLTRPWDCRGNISILNYNDYVDEILTVSNAYTSASVKEAEKLWLDKIKEPKDDSSCASSEVGDLLHQASEGFHEEQSVYPELMSPWEYNCMYSQVPMPMFMGFMPTMHNFIVAGQVDSSENCKLGIGPPNLEAVASFTSTISSMSDQQNP